MSASIQGYFVWHDLMTKDKAAARAFYGELFGWEARDVKVQTPNGELDYVRNYIGDRAVCGFVDLPEDFEMPSHFVGYLGCDDVDATVAAIEAGGGKSLYGILSGEDGGRFAICVDAQGARFQTMDRSPETILSPEDMRPGVVCWNELWASDAKAAADYYGGIYGWSTDEMDMGPMGIYYLQKVGEVPSAGIMQQPMPDAPSSWCPYFFVENVDVSQERAGELGAATMVPPNDIPGMGRFAILNDPSGAMFGIYTGASSS